MNFDVVVVGAGPGGASAAAALARRGYQVLLIDRATFPRDKPCGEFLNPGARDLLAGLGVLPRGREIGYVRLYSRDRFVEVPIRDSLGVDRPALSVRRTELDAQILAAARDAGVTVREGCSVRRPLLAGDRVIGIAGDGRGGPVEVRARVVIAADGSHSTLARQLGLTRPIARLARLAVVAHLHPYQSSRPDAVEMFADDGFGVVGFMPQDAEGAVMSAVIPPRQAHYLAGRAEAFARERLRRVPGVSETVEVTSATTACFGHWLLREWAPGVLFVGDAARFTDPFTGEGIHHAIEGGLIAADVVDDHLRNGSPLSEYARRRKCLRHRYALCDLIQGLVHRPRLFATVHRLLAERPRFAENVVTAIGDLAPVASLVSRHSLASLLSR